MAGRRDSYRAAIVLARRGFLIRKNLHAPNYAPSVYEPEKSHNNHSSLNRNLENFSSLISGLPKFFGRARHIKFLK